MSIKPIIGVLLGDAAGVGPELAAKCAAENYYDAYCRPVIIGDMRVFRRALDVIGADVKVQIIEEIEAADWSQGLPVLDQKDLDPAVVPFAARTVESGKACLDMLGLGVELWRAGRISGVVFGPLNKAALHEAGCIYGGDIDYVADLLGYREPYGEINMTGGLYTTRATSHIPIAEVSEALRADRGERIKRAVRLSYKVLTSAGIENPRIGIAALNPHCGENGDCGWEEIDVITPCIEEMQKEGLNVSGPFPSDIVFHKALVKKEFDSVVTMYHDQGQIALKLIGFDGGVTVLGGFPVPIVTCAHGTAYDIAGKGVASTASFKNAVKLCSAMAATVE